MEGISDAETAIVDNYAHQPNRGLSYFASTKGDGASLAKISDLGPITVARRGSRPAMGDHFIQTPTKSNSTDSGTYYNCSSFSD